MGRRQISLKRIDDATLRHLTFCKRRFALLNRARQLSLLCDAQVALLGFSSSGIPFEYAGSRSMQEIIHAYFDAHKGKPSKPLACSSSHDSQDEIKRLEKGERSTWTSGDMEELKHLSIVELEKLETELAHELQRVRHTKERLIAEQSKEFGRKEQELLRENESLRKELIKMARGTVEATAVSTCSSHNNEDTSSVASVDSHFNL